MASGSFTLTRTGNTSNYITFKCNWTSTSNGSAANSSTVKVTLVASKSSSSTANTYGNYTASATVNGVSQNVASTSFTLAPGKNITLLSKSYTVTHNADGSKTTTISASVGGNVMYGNGSANVTLDKIARYASINQTLAQVTETTIKINWSSDSVIDRVWYSINNGSSWSSASTVNASSGSYTITNLTENTAYKIKTRVRSKATQLNSDSEALNINTYNYPHALSMPSFTIGSKITLGLYNPLGRSVTVNIMGSDGSQISNDTTTGTSISGYNGSLVVDKFYASIPSAKSGTYRVKVTYANNVITKTGGTYSINEIECKPSIGACSYADTNNATTAITANNQLIIRNQSKTLVSATNLVGNKHATIRSCNVLINANTYDMAVNETSASVNNIVIDSASNVTATLTVTDSRGIKATQNFNIQMLDWIKPSAIVNLHRQQNFYSESDIIVNAEYSSIDNKNTIEIKARYKKINDTDYSDYVVLQDNIKSVLNLDNNYEWNVQVFVADLFANVTYNIILGRGMPIIYIDRRLNSVGVNCFPKDEKSVEINGVNVSKNIITAYLNNALTNLAVKTYTKVPLTNSIVIGNKLSFTSNGIKIGAGVNYIKVSAILSYNSIQGDEMRYIRILKNSYTNNNTLAWACTYMAQGNPQTIVIPPMLASVNEGDIIYLFYHTANSNDVISGNPYGHRTSLTIETVG